MNGEEEDLAPRRPLERFLTYIQRRTSERNGEESAITSPHAAKDAMDAVEISNASIPNTACECRRGRKRLQDLLHRDGLDPLDEAEAYTALKAMGYTVSAIGRQVGKSRPYVLHRMRLLKLHPKVRATVRQRTLTPGHGNALLRLEPERQLSLAEQVQAEGLTVKETRQRVREILGKELTWRLVPIRFNRDVYEKLKDMAPNGDVKQLIEQTIHGLITT